MLLALRLGISKETSEHPQAFRSAILQCELDELETHLSKIRSETTVETLDISKKFVKCMVQQADAYPEERILFCLPDKYKHLTELLDRHGYLTKNTDGFMWTDKIGPAMFESGVWDDTFTSRRTIQKEQTKLSAKLALKTMPPEVRALLASNLSDWHYGRHIQLCIALENLNESGEWPWLKEDCVYLHIREVAQEIVALAGQVANASADVQ